MLLSELGGPKTGYLGGVPGLVLQGPREDVVTQVEDQEADDEQRAHDSPHGLPVPVQSAASHGLKVTSKSKQRMGRESLNYSRCRDSLHMPIGSALAPLRFELNHWAGSGSFWREGC